MFLVPLSRSLKALYSSEEARQFSTYLKGYRMLTIPLKELDRLHPFKELDMLHSSQGARQAPILRQASFLSRSKTCSNTLKELDRLHSSQGARQAPFLSLGS
jgi:hypothetical protein